MKKQILVLIAAAVGVMPLFTTGCAVMKGRESAGQYTDDKAITAKVKTALLRDKDVKATEVNVTTFRGVVQLSGFIDSPLGKQRAGEIASTVPGVVEVHNDLVLPTGR
jgi:osmotically-inducible protein OsmY